MPRTSNRRWKGCRLCKMHKHAGHGDAERMPYSARKFFPSRRGKRISRHDAGLWELPVAADFLYEIEFCDSGPAVCVTHMRFIPCRAQGGCVISEDPGDVERTREYQNGIT